MKNKKHLNIRLTKSYWDLKTVQREHEVKTKHYTAECTNSLQQSFINQIFFSHFQRLFVILNDSKVYGESAIKFTHNTVNTELSL